MIALPSLPQLGSFPLYCCKVFNTWINYFSLPLARGYSRALCFQLSAKHRPRQAASLLGLLLQGQGWEGPGIQESLTSKPAWLLPLQCSRGEAASAISRKLIVSLMHCVIWNIATL